MHRFESSGALRFWAERTGVRFANGLGGTCAAVVGLTVFRSVWRRWVHQHSRRQVGQLEELLASLRAGTAGDDGFRDM